MTATMFMLWLIPAALCAVGLMFVEFWEYRHSSDYKPMTLQHLEPGAALSLVPGVNILATAFTFVYILGSIAPNIALLKRKP